MGLGSAAVVDVSLDPAPAPAVRPSPAPPPHVAGPTPPWGWERRVGLVVGITGVAALATGAAFGTWALTSMDSARSQCPSHKDCSQQALALQDDARWGSTVSTVAFVAGAAAVIGGGLLWMVAPADAHAGSPAAARATWRGAPVIDGRTIGFVGEGSF